MSELSQQLNRLIRHFAESPLSGRQKRWELLKQELNELNDPPKANKSRPSPAHKS